MGDLAAAFAELVEKRIGFGLAEDQITRRLMPFAARRTSALHLGSPWLYLEQLEAEPVGGEEWRQVIEALSNGQTSFFRDPEQFAAIGLLLGRARSGRPVWIWSAGCSTGEEAYSLAIVCAELGLAGRARIVATDMNPEFLARAREARFFPWALRNLAPARRTRWFEDQSGVFRVREELRRMVELRRHNLVIDEPLRAVDAGWHAILCRNVFIYFRRQRMAEICRRLTSVLSPDGWLAVAASETLRGLDAPLAPEVIQGRVFYRKTAVRETPPAPAPPGPEPAATRPGPSVIDAAADLARQGDLDAAIELLRGAHADGQWPLAYHLAHGHLQLRRHRIPDALRAYRCAADIDALQCEVHYFEGVAHRKAGDWRAAAAAFRRAIFLAPGFWQAAYLLAGAHERLGNAREAERDRTHAAKLLREARPGVVFLSHPVFVNWFSIPEEEARRNLGIPR